MFHVSKLVTKTAHGMGIVHLYTFQYEWAFSKYKDNYVVGVYKSAPELLKLIMVSIKNKLAPFKTHKLIVLDINKLVP